MAKMTNSHARDGLIASILPPGFYFMAANHVLGVARRLFRWGVLDGSGLGLALGWSHDLSRAGVLSWRARRMTTPTPSPADPSDPRTSAPASRKTP